MTSESASTAERVEARERLVEHERDRIVHERRCELHPLLVAVRERVQPRLSPFLRALAAPASDRRRRPQPPIQA